MNRFTKLLHDIKWWVRWRTTDRFHVIKLLDVAPGYREPEDRMFHSMMQILCDFVEVECPWHSWACGGEKRMPKKRDREMGLAYLDWEIGLKYDENMGVQPEDPDYGKPTAQSISASEIKAIYLWYRDTYQKRGDVQEESGSFVAWENRNTSPEAYNNWSQSCIREHKLEEARHAEDAIYMKRLVDVRRSMWT